MTPAPAAELSREAIAEAIAHDLARVCERLEALATRRAGDPDA